MTLRVQKVKNSNINKNNCKLHITSGFGKKYYIYIKQNLIDHSPLLHSYPQANYLYFDDTRS